MNLGVGTYASFHDVQSIAIDVYQQYIYMVDLPYVRKVALLDKHRFVLLLN